MDLISYYRKRRIALKQKQIENSQAERAARIIESDAKDMIIDSMKDVTSESGSKKDKVSLEEFLRKKGW